MTATGTKPPRETEQAKPATRNGADGEHGRHIGHQVGILAVNVYERGVADVVAFEKDVAKVAPYPWMRQTLTVSAGLIEDVGAAYVRTARQVLR
ncbi:hypothetical protein [Paractinoplanes durhamensis]|uniref:Uncharacterized protein n=1 Tax=Paractinoplanes durhamensis TaxID=113563 RepID=A0ABQ3YRR7_9ACTN|nr:hypothetical protein [Actinoplanes durhamensis]GIE00204.1 hypothetical protein Adu01nite_15540 [Actinoplanes durhamensis]